MDKLLLIREDDELELDVTGPEIWVQVADLQAEGWQVAPDDMQPKPEAKKKAKSASK